MAISSIKDFRAAIQNGDSLIFEQDGNIEVRWEITKILRRIFGFEQNDNLEIANYFSRYLKTLEVNNVVFQRGLALSTNSLDEIEDTIETIKERMKESLKEETLQREYLSNRKRVLNEALKTQETRVLTCELDIIRKELFERAKLEPYHRAVSNLKYLCLSQKYRLSSKDELRKVEDLSNETWLTKKVKEQKRNIFPTSSDDKLTDEEILKIHEICIYPEMVKLMKQDPIILDQNLRFIFRNTLGGCENSVDIAFQFPTIRHRIASCNLDKRVQRLTNDGLKFHELTTGEVKKDVTLLMEGKDISLLDNTKEIAFKSGNATIKEIFHAFKVKDKGITNFEYLTEGVSLCYPFETKVDFQSELWWKNLPTFETITKEELERRCGISLGSSYTIFTVNVSRSNPNFRIDDNHAWLQIAIPQEDDTFRILPIGKYADVYPIGLLDKLFYIFQTKRAAFSCVDENEFYNHREKFSLPFSLSKPEFFTLMDRIKRDLVGTKEGNTIFQAQGENCSAWIQDILDEVFTDKRFSNLFDIKMLDTIVPWPIDGVLSSLNFVRDNISEQAANITRIVLSIILGAWTGLEIKDMSNLSVVKRLVDHNGWQNGYLSLPSFLFKTGVQFKKQLEMLNNP